VCSVPPRQKTRQHDKEEAMNRLLTAALSATILITVVACGDDTNDNPNPCDTANCGQGTCSNVDGQAVCTCKTYWYNSSKGKCSREHDPNKEYLAFTTIGPNSSGKLEVKGQTGPDVKYNKYYTSYSAGEISKGGLWLTLKSVNAAGLPSPSQSGKILDVAHAIKRAIVDPKDLFNKDGSIKEIASPKPFDVLYNGHRATPMTYNKNKNLLTAVPTFKFLATGTLATVKQEDTFYLLDSKPTLSVTATHKGSGKVEFDFTGTRDEGKDSPHMLTFSASGDGTPLTLTAVSGATHKFSATLTGGTHNITVKVTDPNGSSDTKALTVNVDLCKNVQCKAWETCRKLDGKCVGSDPCSPNPCKNGGTCNGSTGTAKCTCVKPWSGKLCETKDLCSGVNCNGHGTCDKTTGKCKCNAGFDPTKNCGDCLANFGPKYPMCKPKPTITGLKVDCSKHSGYCFTGQTYPLTWNSLNATGYTSSTKIISGCSKNPGKVNPSSGTIKNGKTTISYTLGNDCKPATSEITITVSGSGGTAIATHKVIYN